MLLQVYSTFISSKSSGTDFAWDRNGGTEMVCDRNGGTEMVVPKRRGQNGGTEMVGPKRWYTVLNMVFTTLFQQVDSDQNLQFSPIETWGDRVRIQ